MIACVMVHQAVRLPSLANARMHHMMRARIVAGQKQIGAAMAASCARMLATRGLNTKAPRTPPMRVTLTRRGARKLDDDNLAHAFKGVRDGVAAFFGRDDGDDAWTWVYEQDAGPYGVSLKIEVGA